MKNKLASAIGAGFVATTLSSSASEFLSNKVFTTPSADNHGDWCETLQDFGTLYKDKKNPFIQEWKIFGRAHYQYGYSDLDLDGDDFSGGGDELRRFRFGTSIKFLNGFKAGARINIENGGFRRTRIDYADFDELYLSYTKKDVFGLDEAGISYGRFKISFGGEEYLSSKKIKTIERSNLNNFFAPSRATGAISHFEKDDYELAFGIYSSREDSNDWAEWNGGEVYFAQAKYDFGKDGTIRADFIYADASEDQNEILDYEWATSLTYTNEFGPVDLLINGTYGELEDGDGLYGIVILPSMFLIEDRLEAVFRYQWFHSDGENVRPNSRNLRNVSGLNGRTIQRGDDNHTFYAGLNYYLCDSNAKFLFGFEYETLDGRAADANLEATTLWAAFRTYF